MSLRVRLNFLITLLFISLFICSSFYIIAHARTAIHEEVKSTAQLALQLIQIAVSSVSLEKEGRDKHIKLLNSLAKLDETRHLHINIQNPKNVLKPLDEFNTEFEINAPAWFVKLVKPGDMEIKRWLYNPAIPPTGIVIRADPSDEIEENWKEVRGILVFLLIFIILANIMVYVVIGRYLAPIDTILDGLSDIEKGNYQYELPRFRLPELDRISQRFNHMASVLLKSKADNQLLTQRSLEIQEEERRHLSQELHDELGQTITAIKAVAVSVASDKKADAEKVKSSIMTIIEYSDHMYNVAKNMMHRLRPSVLDEFGLIKALQNMIDDWNSRQDEVFCHFSFSDIPEGLPESIKINVFRIIQESLTNVLKHSSADQVKIKIYCETKNNIKNLCLMITDNGIGLDEEAIKPGFGLLGIKERVEMKRGQFNLNSSLNKGLNIDISIPLD